LPKFLTKICYILEEFELGEKAAQFFLLNNKPDADDYQEIVSWYHIFVKLNIYKGPKTPKVPQKPNDILEMIMCDADLDYLGTDSFEEISNNLKKELMWEGKIKTDEQWDLIQIKFLKSHKYFTDYSIRNREDKKNEHLSKLIKKANK
jgi:hypothetical protein